MLDQFLLKHFPMLPSRLNTLKGILKSLLLCRGSQYKQLAEMLNDKRLYDSKIKAISRFLKGDFLPDEGFHTFMEVS